MKNIKAKVRTSWGDGAVLPLLPFQPPEQLQGCVLLFLPWSWEAAGTVLSEQEMCYCAAVGTPGLLCSYSVSPGFTSPLP